VKVLTVIGARPQFIKAAPVSRAFAAHGGTTEILLHTGQHYDRQMSDVFFDELGIPAPGHHLGIGGMTHGAMTGRMLEGIERVLLEEKPDWVLVYGDTNSTLAGALAAAKLHIPVAHVEAGLRSFNMAMPEEVNRRLADHVCSLLFVPTDAGIDNLRREGIARGVHRVGDVMYDAALQFADAAQARSRVLTRLGLAPGGYALATVHRAENTDEPARLDVIFGALAALARELPVVLPVHPRTMKILAQRGFAAPPALHLVEPVGFLDMVMLERHACLVATDSGGVQKEAYFHRVPCVTLRDETEWVELVAAGANRLAPPLDAAVVLAALRAAWKAGWPAGIRTDLYGDGRAAEQIVALMAG